MAGQVLFVAALGGEPGCCGLAASRLAPPVPGLGERGWAHRALGERVEDRPMIGRFEQSPLFELALDLDQTVAKLAQQTNAGRSIVDKGTAATIGAQYPAHHQGVPRAVEPGPGQQRARRMVAPDDKFGDDRRLAGPGAHQARLGPPTQGQPERIEQDRLAGPGLAGQDGQSRSKRQIEPVDQDHVAYGEAKQHPTNNTGAAGAKPARAPTAGRRRAPGRPLPEFRRV